MRAPALVSGFGFAFKSPGLGTVVPVHPAWRIGAVALEFTGDGAVVTVNTTGNFSKAEFEHLKVRNHAALFPRKLCVGHGGCLLVGGLVALLTLPNTCRVLPLIKWCS